MKIKNKILSAIILTFLILILSKNESNAAISASSKTVNSGESVSISISSNIPVCSYIITMTSDGGLTFVNSSGGTGAGTKTITDASSSGMTSLATYTLKAPVVSSDTTYTVSFSASAMEDENLTAIANDSATAKITVKAPVTATREDPSEVGKTPAPSTSNTTNKPSTTTEEKKSSDATLKQLIVAEGAILPEFNPETKEYALNVSNEITALNITAISNNSKAAVNIEGNSDLKNGENKITITVIAEDGTTNVYIINVTRQKVNISLTSLKITYIDEDGNVKELLLNPTFDPAILEYNLEELSYLINSLDIKAIANLEGAIVEIKGNDNLAEGQNTITITIAMKAEPAIEGEEQEQDEVLVYTINVMKQAKPTFWQKVKNWFNGVIGSIETFYSNNQGGLILGALGFCIVALLGLSVYIILDYKKYKSLVEKLKNLNGLNKNAVIEQNVSENVDINNIEENNLSEENSSEENNKSDKQKAGRHF